MILAHNIGDIADNSNYNTLEQLVENNQPLSFDGIYENVYKHRLHFAHRNPILFIMGDYVGLDNSFDKGQPLEKLCTWAQLREMESIGFELQWHTWSHRDLTTLTSKEVIQELTQPFGFTKIAYPYGRFNDEVIAIAKSLGYTKGFSVTDGDDSDFQRLREYL